MSIETEAAEVTFTAEKALTLRYIPMHLGIFLVLVFVWEMANRLGLVDPLLFPKPTEIVQATRGLWSSRQDSLTA